MTRKHFRLLANALLTSMPTQRSDTYEAELLLFENIADSIMRACAEANPHFDRAKFAKACGLDTIRDRCSVCEATNVPEPTQLAA
jgi:hypothetical protein